MTSVYTSPVKRSRRLDIRTLSKAIKYINKRPYPPGQHGQSRKSKPSDFAIQLLEKQRAKFIYGIRERQFRNIYDIASSSPQQTGEKLLQLLELRADNILYRAGLAKTRRHARQLITHGHFKVNGKRMSIPSYRCTKDEMISPYRALKPEDTESYSWLKTDKNGSIKIIKIPTRDEIPHEINEQLIIEYYSR